MVQQFLAHGECEDWTTVGGFATFHSAFPWSETPSNSSAFYRVRSDESN